MKSLIILFISFTVFSCSNSHEQIIAELEEMTITDQKWRGLLQTLDNGYKTELDREKIIEKMNVTDSLNSIGLSRIFEKYGFVDYERFGKKASNNFWLLVQHQDKNLNFQSEVLEEMKVAVEKNIASSQDFAYLTDRIKINSGLKQIYGTQMMLNEDKSSFIPKPTENIENINLRRQNVGLTSIEEYIELMNNEYFGILE